MGHHRRRVTVERPGSPGLYQISMLPGWEIIGTVTAGDYAGALVRNLRTGIYCMANNGGLRSLPQHKVTTALMDNGRQQ